MVVQLLSSISKRKRQTKPSALRISKSNDLISEGFVHGNMCVQLPMRDNMQYGIILRA